MLTGETEMTEIGVQSSTQETANNQIVVKEEKKEDYELWFTYSRNIKIVLWKYISFIFKPDSFENVDGSYIDIASILPQPSL